MSQEHDKSKSDDAPLEDEIHPESAPFEPSYQPETLPQITVPDLAEDAQGLSAEALAQVPTLTDLVDATAADGIGESGAFALEKPEPDSEIQDTPAQADTWVEELQVRMEKLNDDIHTLNARLDRLEERNKIKV
jgi:hypothetical protein